jgi:hypothetical protein
MNHTMPMTRREQIAFLSGAAAWLGAALVALSILLLIAGGSDGGSTCVDGHDHIGSAVALAGFCGIAAAVTAVGGLVTAITRRGVNRAPGVFLLLLGVLVAPFALLLAALGSAPCAMY